ncbi:MAG: SusC/RagA family TonB-linked outer membrane protein [Saprospiraceae bacterium]
MKKIFNIFSFMLLLLLPGLTMAQAITVKGKVMEDNGDPLFGVNVLLKDTNRGVITDLNGEFSIEANIGQTLVISYIGFDTKAVVINSSEPMSVTLATANVLDEVVVTALGISRDKKALQYSVTEIGGDNFTQARVNNLGNALSGRVAGVNVTPMSTGPGGSSRVIIRGNKTLGGANQPLYVIDGVPIDNSQQGTVGLWGGSDQGDGLSSINPDDIETITVLKGANAAALYGSRGGNGVINITTKKGSNRKGIGVEFNTNNVAEQLVDFSELQTTYGMGAYINGVATKPTTVQQASDWGLQGWGPKLDGSQVIGIDGKQHPYAYAGNNFDKFYNTGYSTTNGLAFTGGTATQNFRLGLTDLRSKGIVPNSGFDRLNVSVSTDSKFGKKLTLVGKVLYAKETTNNRPRVSDSPGNANEAIWRLPANVNVEDTKGDPNKPGAVPADWDPSLYSSANRQIGNENLSNYNNFWGSNAYWSAYQFKDNSKRDRITASAQLKYDITSFLYLSGRVSTDFYNTKVAQLTPQGTGYQLGGGINEYFQKNSENNYDAMLGFDKTFGKLSVNAFVGGNQQRGQFERISANGNGFSVPFFGVLNVANNRNFGYGFSQSGINSLYGSAEFGWNNVLYITGTARKDWFSILNGKNILYPSVGGSFIFSDAFKNAMPSWLSYGKLRASWAQVGLTGNLGAYQLSQPYSLNGNPHLGISMASFANKGTIANPNLNPALSTELEFGLDLKFFNGRMGLDIGVYDQKTTDDILNATISTASGFNSTSVNIGKLSNKGIEVLLSGTPIESKNFIWDVSLNFAKNNNKVISLIAGLNELTFEESRTRTTFIKHIVGQPFGVITGITQKMLNGKPVFTDQGLPVTDGSYKPIGKSVADFTGGLNNSFTYKGFNLSFLIDVKMGGDIHSGTNQSIDGWGFSQRSLQGRAGEAPLTVSGVNEKGEPLNLTLTPQQAASYWGNLGGRNAAAYIYDASFAKLRQLTFGYNLPKKLIANTPFQNVGISLVARNLAVLYKNVPNIDPESSYSFNGGAQGLDYFALPSTRSVGLNLHVGF